MLNNNTAVQQKSITKLTTGQVLPLLIDVMLGHTTMEEVGTKTNKTVGELEIIYRQLLTKLAVELGNLQTKVEVVAGIIKEGIDDNQMAIGMMKSAEKRLNEISGRLLTLSKT